MIIPHLMFAHMLADYTLQTNWLAVRKVQGWDGLSLHGVMVFFMSVLLLAPYIQVALPALVVMALLHTGQDWLKGYTGPRIKVHSFIPYVVDQALHYSLVILVQLWLGPQINPGPSLAEQTFMAAGAVAVAVTRLYDVSWWANWLDMIPYMNRWERWGYAERLAMTALTAGGLFFLAPLCAVPRVVYAQVIGAPIWKQPRGVLEVPLGVIFCMVLGFVLRAMITA